MSNWIHEAGLEVKRSPISGIKIIFVAFQSLYFFLGSNISHAPRTLLRTYWLVLLGHGTALTMITTGVVNRKSGSLYPWSRFMAACPILISLASLTFLFSLVSSLSSTLTLSFVICGICAHSVLRQLFNTGFLRLRWSFILVASVLPVWPCMWGGILGTPPCIPDLISERQVFFPLDIPGWIEWS